MRQLELVTLAARLGAGGQQGREPVRVSQLESVSQSQQESEFVDYAARYTFFVLTYSTYTDLLVLT